MEKIVELMSTGFLSALFAIVVIDLVLAGDNAIVIALAARSVPKHLQKKAIIWGTLGAIVMRTSLTMVVVWLLKVPGLLAAGGALLIWIAYRLLTPDDSKGQDVHAHASKGFWGAMRTIVVADTIMGLDNVLAVAGAAHGSFLLVVCGLLISIPIVIWGSTLILGVVERYPAFVYLGAGVLAWTSAKMIASEPLLHPWLHAHAIIVPMLYTVLVGGVLAAGFFKNHLHRESRISAHLAIHARQKAALLNNKGDQTMLKILVPVDASPNSLLALQQVVREFFQNTDMEVHLLHVQTPIPRHIGRFVSKRNLDAWRRDEAEKALGPTRSLLEKHSIPCAEHIEKGKKAETIVAVAKRLQADHIVMGTARKNSLTRMLESSVTSKVLELTSVPVEVVTGGAVSKFEKFGIPAGLGAALALLLLAIAD
ncbi:YjbE family putative metal transport protein [Uliginosibacterium sp. 31-16]|uniref:YjbE family putative metal transport protein n=1 Tax=Uliginosibacterium sp. 31-16 TaxID=3068315 RepID=UPI00273F18AB|nr:YjbE family putative metal transport protein [Uliginosibacterium sp. 31-16]MDP5241171.1 YjbE family putative metal transport protein [Uliginosibacterium sp. 31-16]